MFFQLLRSAAENAVDSANLMTQLLADPARYPELSPAIKELESKGDHLTHDVYALMHKSFLTPLERHDLVALAGAIDSVVDAMEAAAARIGIYKVEQTDRILKAFGPILRSQSAEMVSAIDMLAGKKMTAIREKIFQINVLENQGDELLRSGLSSLFEQAQVNPVKFVTMKEIYGFLEEATDRVEDVANIIEGVVMKKS